LFPGKLLELFGMSSYVTLVHGDLKNLRNPRYKELIGDGVDYILYYDPGELIEVGRTLENTRKIFKVFEQIAKPGLLLVTFFRRSQLEGQAAFQYLIKAAWVLSESVDIPTAHPSNRWAMLDIPYVRLTFDRIGISEFNRRLASLDVSEVENVYYTPERRKLLDGYDLKLRQIHHNEAEYEIAISDLDGDLAGWLSRIRKIYDEAERETLRRFGANKKTSVNIYLVGDWVPVTSQHSAPIDATLIFRELFMFDPLVRRTRYF
jgi:hypothetical protein